MHIRDCFPAPRPSASSAIVLSWVAKLFALVAAVQILGGHWMALQSVAWVGMAIDYTKRASLSVLVEKPSDGGYPCHLCETVSKGRSHEQKHESTKLVLKFEAVLGTRLAVPKPAEQFRIFARFVGTPRAVALAPPTPPPLV